eukprot:664083-Amphidinium_carterae.1
MRRDSPQRGTTMAVEDLVLQLWTARRMSSLSGRLRPRERAWDTTVQPIAEGQRRWQYPDVANVCL